MTDFLISNESRSPRFSFYKNCITPAPESEISFDEFLHHIKSGTYGRLIRQYIDLSCSDLERLCIISSDPDLYSNPEARVFNPKPASIAKTFASLPTFNSVEEDIKKVIEQIEQRHLDITNGYANWLNIGFALNDALGNSGRGYFHTVSQYNSKYKASDCDKQYDHIEKSSNSGITIKTFFQYARDCGIDIRPAGKGPHKESTRTPKQQIRTESDSSELEEGLEQPDKKKLTSNKFILASEYIKEHYQIRNNIVSNEYECREIGVENFEMLNENNIFIKMQFSGLNINLNNLVALLKSDFIERYDPFREYFGALPAWDKSTDYITALAQFIKTKDRTRFDVHFKKWLILCPSSLSNYIAENLSIDKDSRILLTRNLFINLDELSTLSKVEINSLKSLFSKDKINDRLPYDRRNSIIPRRCSFVGSTNQTEFLNDESGSVRWLCFVIDEIDWDYKNKVNIDPGYSQAYDLYKNGFEYNLTQEEIRENDDYNKQFQLISSERELVFKFIQPGSKEENDCFMTATDILMHLATRTENKVKMSAVCIGRAMKFCGIERVKHRTQQVYGYYVKLE
jgi:hypothetical protein